MEFFYSCFCSGHEKYNTNVLVHYLLQNLITPVVFICFVVVVVLLPLISIGLLCFP